MKALSSSRAYELIAIANGTKTVESLRAEVNARKQEFRERAGVRSGTESTEPQANQALSENKPANPPKRGRPAAPKTQHEGLEHTSRDRNS